MEAEASRRNLIAVVVTRQIPSNFQRMFCKSFAVSFSVLKLIIDCPSYSTGNRVRGVIDVFFARSWQS